jgi:hypothetical protein
MCGAFEHNEMVYALPTNPCVWWETDKPLSSADGVGILGAVLFYLREKDVCLSLSDMGSNNAAQGTVLTLRHQQWQRCYGRERR